MQPSRLPIVASAAVLLVAGGCTSPAEPSPKTPVETRLEVIAELLARHVVDAGRRPASEAAFRDYMENRGRDTLTACGIESIENLLTSPRDGRKFVILYEGDQDAVRGEIWAHEAEGRGGTRAVVDSLGRARLMPEEDFQRLLTANSS